MKIEKIKKTYNDYKLELSFGQLEAISNALAANHSDPLADELYAEWQWYTERIPGPGVDEEDIKAEQEQAQAGGPEGAREGEDVPVTMPPGSEAGTPPEGGEPMGFPPAAGGKSGKASPKGKPGEPEGLKILKGEEPPAGGQVGLPEPGMDSGETAERPHPAHAASAASAAEPSEVNHRLPPPPRE
jgi:hypothetical protein